MLYKPSVWFAFLLAIVISLAPTLVDARAGGGGSSMGSRGTRTYQAAPSTPTAPRSQSVERSVTPAPQAPAARPISPLQPQPSFFSGHPFLSGLMGGFIGAGIGGLLFGHGFFGGGFGFGFAGLLGILLQLALVVVLVRVGMALFRGRLQGPSRRNFAYATADDPGVHAHRPIGDDASTGGSAPGAKSVSRDEIGISGADYAEFERLLVGVQTAWSGGDIAGLRRCLTPEMVSYFSEKLSANASAGIENRVEDVRFETGDLAEAWSDGDLQYATVAMRWTARDYTVRADTGVLAEGQASERIEATEVWTFVRAPGGRWLLSAIQQV